MRILYGLDRFSEDLDFTLLKSEENFDFTPYLEGMKKELASFGFTLEVTKKIKNIETSIVSAFMKINTIELYLALGEEKKTQKMVHNEKIQIKLEVDIDPPAAARFENRLVLNPINFYVLTLNKSDLFAGKIAAILYRAWKGRVKGRDWYDLIWYIQNKIPVSLVYLKACLKPAGKLEPASDLDRSQLLGMLNEKIQSIDWESAKSDVRSFLIDPQKLDIWSSQFFSDLLSHLLIE